jgi:hypothetical protein
VEEARLAVAKTVRTKVLGILNKGICIYLLPYVGFLKDGGLSTRGVMRSKKSEAMGVKEE